MATFDPWNQAGGVWAAKAGTWHWFEDLGEHGVCRRSICGTLLFADDADRDAATNRDPRGPVLGWPCRLCMRILENGIKVPVEEQIAILRLLLNILADETRYDALANAAAREAYQRFKEGDERIQFVVEVEPGVWLSKTVGDPGRTLEEESAEQYSARGAILALTDARRYRSFASARILPVRQKETKHDGQ